MSTKIEAVVRCGCTDPLRRRSSQPAWRTAPAWRPRLTRDEMERATEAGREQQVTTARRERERMELPASDPAPAKIVTTRPYTPSFDYVPGSTEPDDAYLRPPFRVRAWPPPAKVFTDATRGEHEELPRFNEMLDRVEEVRGRRVRDEPSWREKMWMYCDGSASSDDFSTPQADDAFEELEVEMRESDTFHLVPEGAERTLVAWLAKNDVDVLAVLIDEEWLSTGCNLYPPCMQEWQHDSGGEAESLLCIAAKDVCSV
jgi:hypothetical protein